MLSHRSSSALVGRTGVSKAVHARQAHFGRSRFSDWESKQDTNFLRYQRHRFLNTRAKLLKTIHRRMQWDLPSSFFTPKHIRLASHYYGRRGSFGRWQKDRNNDDDRQEWNESDDYELSSKEKSWKDHMDSMQKRVETDPYEAVFGRRLEPFWGSLLPGWMRTPEVEPPVTSKKSKDQPSYAAYSSTSWDSWTNKCKKTQWDTVSGQTRNYEYDPITNRMIQLPTNSPPKSKTAETETRKAIPIPRFAEPEVQSSPMESLTAYGIRAAMGKNRARDDAQVDILLSESKRSKQATSQWEHAEDFVALEQEVEGLKAQKDKLLLHERRAFHFADLAKRLEAIQSRITAAEARLETMNAERAAMNAGMPHKTSTLRPAVDRMQSKPIQRALDADDAAAHESTESTSTTIPKAWANQADLLQAQRVQRTTSSKPFLHEQLSKAGEMLQIEIDRQKLVMNLHEERHKDSVRVLKGELVAAINSPEALQARVDEMQQAESKYKSKIAALKQELDIAYKQSSRHADEFRDQIKQSEARNLKLAQLEDKYKRKIAGLREDLDTAFKQSSEHADEFRHQISQAQNAATGQETTMVRLSKATERKYKAQIGALKDELNLAYEQSSRHADEFRRQIEALEAKLANAPKQTGPVSQKEQDRTLIRQIRSIYEDQYGIIGREKSLDECLNDYDTQRSYTFKRDNLEAELSAGQTPATQKTSPPQSESELLKVYKANEKRSAYDFTGDNLEAELQEPHPVQSKYKSVRPAIDSHSETELLRAYQANEKRSAYSFTCDNLETELQETQPTKRKSASPAVNLHGEAELLKAYESNEKQAAYDFTADNLEAELKPAKDELVKNSEGIYRFRKDNLEHELKAQGKTVPEKKHSFKHDGLEAELAARHTQPAPSATPSGLDNKSYAFKQDNLEAELAAQSSAEVARRNRATLRQRLAEDFKDVAKMLTEVRSGRVAGRRNPIDGMTPAVGNYASPTGFVNYDDPAQPDESIKNTVHRQEPVFSGTQRVRHSRRARTELGDRYRRRRKTRRLLKAAALAALVAALYVYAEGASLEAHEDRVKARLQRETWDQIAREYSRSGERGIVKAMNEMQATDTQRRSGLFWR